MERKKAAAPVKQNHRRTVGVTCFLAARHPNAQKVAAQSLLMEPPIAPTAKKTASLRR